MKGFVLMLVFSLAMCFSVVTSHAAGEKWQGVDETVVEKYASEHGHPARPNLINLEGDTLLFAFLLAGTAGGFVLGYYYRDFMSKKGHGGRV
ncbi:MAG: cobalt transporter [Nitrospirota bacterium]